MKEMSLGILEFSQEKARNRKIVVHFLSSDLIISSSFTASAANFLIPSASLSVAIASSFRSQRNFFSSREILSMSCFLAEE